MAEHVLVTGGAGFIGSHLVDALIDRGHRVRVLDNLEPQVHGNLAEKGAKPEYLNPGAEFWMGDIQDTNIVSSALAGIDVVFHLAARVGVGQSMYEITRYTETNTFGTAVLLQAIVNAHNRPRKLVVASSMSIYGEGKYTCQDHGTVYPKLRTIEQLKKQDWEMRCPVPGCRLSVDPLPTSEDKFLFPTSIYAINKRDQEEMFLAIGQTYNIPTVALRYFNTYGTRQALSNPYTGVAAIFSSRLLNGKPPVIYEDGMQQRDFVHVSDIVQANLLVMESSKADFEIFNVGTGRALSILQVAEILINHFSRNSNDTAVELLRPEILSQFRAGDIRHCYGDISRLAALGFTPRVRFEDGVSDLMNWVRLQSSSEQFDAARSELERRGLAI